MIKESLLKINETVAKLLLSIKAITLSPEKPFTFTSGIKSPIYCDNRLVISYPKVRQQIIEAFLDVIAKKQMVFDIVAGTATAGIPHAAWLADRLSKPMVYVRNTSKSHGKANQIEGHFEKGQRALVVEDHISTGGSAINATMALRQQGLVVNDCIAISTYGFSDTDKHFNDHQITLTTLTDFNTIINIAICTGDLNIDEKNNTLQWQHNPQAWQGNA